MSKLSKTRAMTKIVVGVIVPSWVSYLFTLLALCLVPWTIYLAYALPRHSVVHNWDTTWVGLDIGIMILLLLSGLLASLKSRWIVLTLTAVSSFLVVDAWFDIQSSKAGIQQTESVLMALLIEIPLSILGFRLAYTILKKLTN